MFLKELNELYNKVRSELTKRESGIKGTGTVSELELILEELNKIRTQIQTNALPNHENRSLVFPRIILDTWPIDSQLARQLVAIANKYKRQL